MKPRWWWTRQRRELHDGVSHIVCALNDTWTRLDELAKTLEGDAAYQIGAAMAELDDRWRIDDLLSVAFVTFDHEESK
mgnify:CR=1 FL=1